MFCHVSRLPTATYIGFWVLPERQGVGLDLRSEVTIEVSWWWDR